MSDRARRIINTAQCMSYEDALDFIDEHCTADEIAEWVADAHDTEAKLYQSAGIPSIYLNRHRKMEES